MRSCSTATRAGRSWSLRGPLCEGWPIHDLSVDPATGAILAAGGSAWYGPAVFRSDDLGATWTHSSEGLTYGDDGPKIPTIWNVTAAHGSIWAGVEPAGLFRSDDDGATWSHVSGLRDHPSRPGWQPGAGGLICHTIVPHPTDAVQDVGRDQRGRHLRDGGRRRDLGGPQPRRRRRRLAGSLPRDRPVRPQARHGRGPARPLLPAEPLRRVSLGRRRTELGGHQRRPALGVRVRDGGPSARRDDRLGDPADPSRGGQARARRRAGGVADERPRRQLGAARRRPAAGERVRRRPPRGAGRRSARSGRGLLRDEHRPALRLGRRGRDAGTSSPPTCRRSGASRRVVVD